MVYKQFTVKDFVTYNNPCFSCNSKISFNFGFTNKLQNYPTSYISSTVTQERTEIDLKITYNNVLQLWIFHKSNKILCSNTRNLTEYLDTHNLFMNSHCHQCYTSVTSTNLKFDLDKACIKPVSLFSEIISVTDHKNTYYMINNYHNELSILKIDSLTQDSNSQLKFKLPIMPMYKFKNKEHFLKKMKNFIVYS